MKKRQMKKWIPKDTDYCYDNSGLCKWYQYLGQRNYKYTENGEEKIEIVPVKGCMYLGLNDFDSDDLLILHDQCKECGEHLSWNTQERFYRYFKKLGRYKKNNRM